MILIKLNLHNANCLSSSNYYPSVKILPLPMMNDFFANHKFTVQPLYNSEPKAVSKLYVFAWLGETQKCVSKLTIIGSDNGWLLWTAEQCWNIVNWILGTKLQ